MGVVTFVLGAGHAVPSPSDFALAALATPWWSTGVLTTSKLD